MRARACSLSLLRSVSLCSQPVAQTGLCYHSHCRWYQEFMERIGNRYICRTDKPMPGEESRCLVDPDAPIGRTIHWELLLPSALCETR
ncbi:hypothetical protein DL89DRAFT_121584 [Linderina pennispora]|uniref:Secreted protein n=1 Tax=Linderina pennispora TaxID=61395 RepID=A0A1Y1WCZ4_9FUNG|nr:uncharacterized protein DL89DRAFT_121584 [Linderina pennispora]ORX71208.1 hypothetical protein DL89DRAFT_121584 [Linderina pennispora]